MYSSERALSISPSNRENRDFGERFSEKVTVFMSQKVTFFLCLKAKG